MEEKEIPRTDQYSFFGGINMSLNATGVGLKTNEYKIGDNTFLLQTDFTYAELEWLDVVYDKLQVGSQQSAVSNEIRGTFTKNEIEKTLKILLIPHPNPLPKGEGMSPDACPDSIGGRGAGVGFTHEDFLNTRESQSVKIIADFFLNESSIRLFYEQLFGELNKAETDADAEYNHLRGYSVSYFKGNPYLIPLPAEEEVLYQLMHGDPLLSEESKTKLKRMKILNYYYRSRVNRLNELLAGIEQLKQIEKSKD